MKGNSSFTAIAALLVAAFAVGGAGQNFPLLEMALDILALGVAASLVWRPRGERLAPLSRWALVLLGAILLLPAIQLVPLPPAIWHALPGRDLAAQVDSNLGLASWRPLTLDVEGTLRAVLSLIPAGVVFAGCLRLHSPERTRLLMIVAAFALINAILGIAQLASGGSMTPYPSAHLGYPIGLFVNRNHNAAFLLMSMPAIAALGAMQARRSSSRLSYVIGTLATLTIIGIVIIATTSRMALLLLPLAFAGALVILFFRQSFWRTSVPATLVLGLVAAVISWAGGFSRNLARFSSLHDARFNYWDDVHWALGHYGLAGTGFGTFVPVYQTAESLSGVSPQILNHAHNDFIEVVLEGGAPAIALLLLFFVLLAFAAVRLVRRPFEMNRALLSLAAAVGLVMLLAFSLVDYPLRMPALGSAFALLCACLLPGPVRRATGNEIARTDRKSLVARRWRSGAARGAALAAIAVACVLVVQAGVSKANLLADQDQYALQWAPWSTAAHEAAADDALASMRPKEAMDEALSTLRLSPINVPAIRTAAMVKMLTGSPTTGGRLMEIAVTLGWRDPLTQLWAIDASERAGEPKKALERAEALFRQQLYPPTALALLLQDAPDGPTSGLLVTTLQSRPAWRAQFLRAGSELPPAYLAKLDLVTTRLDQGRAPLTIDEAQPLLDRLIAIGDLPSAQRLWLGTHRDGLIANGGFEELSSRGGADVPSNWDISDEDLPTIALQVPRFGGRGRALRISAAARSGPILSQRLMLPPGSYALTYQARSGQGGEVALRWEMRCASSDESQSVDQPPAASGGWQQFTLHFAVPFQDCPIQRLALERPNVIHTQEIWLDQLVLRPSR